MTSDSTILSRIPRSIWALGFGSSLIDVSSELVHGLLPVSSVSVPGASAFMVGLIEGAGEATARLLICTVWLTGFSI